MTDDRQKIAAFSDALNRALDQGEEGLKLAVQILENEKGQFKLAMYDLIWENLDDRGKKQLWQYLVKNKQTVSDK
jgi:hypothetical protein